MSVFTRERERAWAQVWLGAICASRGALGYNFLKEARSPAKSEDEGRSERRMLCRKVGE